MIAINMEMPKSCSQCPLCIEDKYADMTCVLLCEEWEESNYNENHRDENCPLAEIVTCKDCKYREKVHPHWLSNKKAKVYFCTLQSDEHCYEVEDDDFCESGERRE